MRLFCDCKTDAEKSAFFLSGRAVETGIIAAAISNDVAMAYHRCAQFKKENDELRAKIKAMEQQEPVAWLHETRRDSDVVTDAVKCVWQRARPMSLASYTIPLYLAPGAQPAPSDEYVGWYCAHCERGVDASEVTYHEQHQVCGRVITEDKPPKPAPSIPEGWLRAIDEALVVAHIGVANESDTYEQAKAKLDSLIGFHVDVATDPAVNGGWKLVQTAPEDKP